jgi:hypothetical protein
MLNTRNILDIVCVGTCQKLISFTYRIFCCSLAIVFAFSVIIVTAVFGMNLRRSHRQVLHSTQRHLGCHNNT